MLKNIFKTISLVCLFVSMAQAGETKAISCSTYLPQIGLLKIYAGVRLENVRYENFERKEDICRVDIATGSSVCSEETTLLSLLTQAQFNRVFFRFISDELFLDKKRAVQTVGELNSINYPGIDIPLLRSEYSLDIELNDSFAIEKLDMVMVPNFAAGKIYYSYEGENLQAGLSCSLRSYDPLMGVL